MPQSDSGKMLNVIAKSWTDEGFKKRLTDDPKGTLASEGIDVPPQANVKVIHQQPNDMHVIIPPKPAGNIDVKNVGEHLHSTTLMTFRGTADMTIANTADMTIFHASGSDPAKK